MNKLKTHHSCFSLNVFLGFLSLRKRRRIIDHDYEETKTCVLIFVAVRMACKTRVKILD